MANWADIFTGALIAEVPVLFNWDGIPDLDAIARFSDSLARKPIDGVAVKFDALNRQNQNPEIIAKFLETWRKALPEPLTLTVGIDLSPKINADIIASIFDHADFILAGIDASTVEIHDADSIGNLYRDIAKHEIPVIVDFSSDNSGELPFKPDLLPDLLAMDEIAGVRLAMHDHQILMQDLITHVRMKFPEKAILSGCDRFYGYSLYRGCHGALTRLGPILPGIQREMVDAWFMCETTVFLQLCRLVDNLAESIFHEPLEGVNARILAALAHTGLISEENAIDPQNPKLSAKDREFVYATIDALGELTDAGS